MSESLVTAPTNPVLSTAEAKQHLRVTTSTQDSYIDSKVKACTLEAENFLGRKLITQTWKKFFDFFPGYRRGSNAWLSESRNFGTRDCLKIKLPFAPVQSVTHIKYYDVDGDQVTLDSSYYQTDFVKEPCEISLAVDQAAWPETQLYKVNAVEIQFVCGYGTNGNNVPENIREAIRYMLGYNYDNRSNDKAVMDSVAEKMLWYERIMEF